MASIQGLYYPFYIIQGETFGFGFEFTIDGVEQYFDEYTFDGQIREANNTTVLSATLTFTESEDSASVVSVALSAATTGGMLTDNHLYEIKATNIETGEVRTLFYGTFQVKRSLIGQNLQSFTPPVIPPVIP